MFIGRGEDDKCFVKLQKVSLVNDLHKVSTSDEADQWVLITGVTDRLSEKNKGSQPATSW